MGWFSWEPKIEKAIISFDLIPILRSLAPDAGIFYNDRDYFIPADPADVMWASPSKDYKYIKESRDCDDHVRILRGWLSQKGFGNLLAMDCEIDIPTGRHALIAFLQDGKLVFGEPQTGRMIEYPEFNVVRLIV